MIGILILAVTDTLRRKTVFPYEAVPIEEAVMAGKTWSRQSPRPGKE